MQVINPATEEQIEVIPEDSPATIQAKYEQVRAGQAAWAAQPLEQRIACLARFHELLDTHREDLARTLTGEMGKPLQQARNELNGARGRIRFFLEHSARWLAEEWITPEGPTREKIVYEPLGVIANISAWNYPYLVGVNVFVPALLGGNAVLYKPSEYATRTGLAIERLLYQSGVPRDVFQAVVGRGDAGRALLDLPLDGYYFTGSYATGRQIAQHVAGNLVPCQLELGGKDPLYVMDDVADIDQVAAAALEGVVYNNGQSCCAVERIYVHRNIYEPFVEAYVKKMRALRVGDPLDPATDIGPLSRPQQRQFLLDQIEEARSLGARVLEGGQVLPPKGYYLAPVVLLDVDHRMKVMTEESFGPVTGIMAVADDREALDLMQDTPYGLTAAVYSRSYERAEALMKQCQTGTVYWNCCDRVSASLPWSGRKHSGLGSTLSYQGIRAFVQPKAYHLRPST
ncbi:MAG TPA: aldehyde dehydrogenase family protein [Chitinophagaceae bacterium]|nr:aldehyde dehydrogenase family protein [Chitinophagaceae bacterium]